MLTYDELIVHARMPTGYGGPDGTQQDVFTDEQVGERANMVYRLLLNKHAFREKEVTAVIDTTRGVRNYTMPDPHDGLRQIDIMDPTTSQHMRVDPMSVDEYTQRWNESEHHYGFPTHYVRESCLFRLWPTPDAAYKLTVRYWGILLDISTSNQLIAIPQEWIVPIKYGTTAMLFADKGDLGRAEAYMNLQSKFVSDIIPIQTKEEEDYRRAGLEVLGREY